MRQLRWLLISLVALLLASAYAEKLLFVLDVTEIRADKGQAIVAQLQEIGIEAHTVRFVYEQTFPQQLVLQALTHFQIVPKDHLTEVG